MRWVGPGEARLWLETPEPEHRRSRGRYATLAEAATMIQILAREDRVAMDGLGDLDTDSWAQGTT